MKHSVVIVDRMVAEYCLVAERDEPSGLACVLSISDSKRLGSVLQGYDEFTGHKLALFFDDIWDRKPNHVLPTAKHAKQIVEWAREVQGPALLHCNAGISRSTAAAIAIPASQCSPSQDNARAIMLWLAAVRPTADPNPLLVRLIDKELGWKRHLVEARDWRFSGG